MASLYLAVAGERGDGGFGRGWAPAPPPSPARRALAGLAALVLAAGVQLWSSLPADAHVAVAPSKPGFVADHDDGPDGDGDGDGGPGTARPLATVDG